jgi:hypothetical protein
MVKNAAMHMGAQIDLQHNNFISFGFMSSSGIYESVSSSTCGFLRKFQFSKWLSLPTVHKCSLFSMPSPKPFHLSVFLIKVILIAMS